MNATYCVSWLFAGKARHAGGSTSGEGGATESRSGRVARASRLLDGVALAEAQAEEIFDLLPHLVVVAVCYCGSGSGCVEVVMWSGRRREGEGAGVRNMVSFVYVE
jgi:hypothetical protein